MGNITIGLIVSIVGTLVTGVFTMLVFRRWLAKRREGRSAPHLLAWSIGLLLYFLGVLSQVVLYFTWSPFFFSVWYWSGALMVAAWLGQGTVYLLARKGNLARNLMMVLILVSLMTLPMTFMTQYRAENWEAGKDMTALYRDVTDSDGNVVRDGIFPASSRGTVRFFSPIMNVWGTITLVGGAIYSALLFRRKQIMRDRMIGNLLIAAGGLFPAFAGALVRLGDPSFKYFGEMAGAILIFIGFMLASRAVDDVRDAAEARKRRPAQAVGD
ncbi:MAG: hypothetical protein IT298_15580 [Chloroflexi bacterium]|jgi:hypothetical protein|nr:MAG: hypothetical protein UZ13_03660 [Chloroflexi bacterium OLB13]MBC6957442.1 hypothetical protein [Chloroflexota bacterium]MBV6437174.1 hypothetical protein [Anaerolineae bacterium]OQY76681.1 MAG: hypothetical protein B6D42_16865 [Anaerolineae bacterium UTCFX5]MBW7879174.1 hypothetical protein [Anaerolineae bacterium]